jgi:LysR family hydrogen peroxide-inducible transcriptional activator
MRLEAGLRAFAAFARKRSFSSAAEELGISQPTVSRHLSELEQKLGIKLVDLEVYRLSKNRRRRARGYN